MPKNVKTPNLIKRSACLIARILLLVVCVAFLGAFVSSFTAKTVSAKEKKVKVGWYESTYCYTDSNGRRVGLAYEYQQRVAAYAGWTIEYVNGTWDELYNMLKDGDIDVLSDVSLREDRVGLMLYPSIPMGSEDYYMYIMSGNSVLNPSDIRTFKNAKIGVIPDSVPEDLLIEWADSNHIQIEIADMAGVSIQDSFEMLKNGEIDAYVYFDSMGNEDECIPVFNIGESDYFFAVNKGRPDILYELNQALIRIRNEDPHYNQKLYEKYIYPVSTSTFLSEKELDWLEEHGAIRVGYRDNYLPFCTQKDGALYGTFSDYLKYAGSSMKNGVIKFEPVPYASTEESLKALYNGEIDAVFPLLLSPYDCEEMSLLATNPIMRTEVYAVVADRTKDIINGDDTKVSLLEGNINFDHFVRDVFPEWTVQNHYSNLEDCYKSVADGDADCAMVASYRINKTEALRRRYNLALMTTGQDMTFSIAVSNKDIELFSILNKTANVGTENKLEYYYYKYYAEDEKITFKDYLKDNLLTAILALSIVLIIILILILLKMRSDKEAKNRQELISETEHDPLTGLYTRNFFFAYAERMYREHPEYKMDAIVVNIEQFHTVNALYGWDFGDIILKTLGTEIASYIGENDGIACRSTADRFDIYCPHMEDYKVLFDRLQRKVDEAAGNIIILLRMGVMPWQKDLNPVQLFDRARTACSMVKGVHHSRIMVFSEEMRQKELKDQRLLNDIKKAVEKKEFQVYYQPKYAVLDGEPVLKSAEALIRWNHSEFGMIPPGIFIDLFEKNNVIGILDKYVWSTVAWQIAVWRVKYGVALPISVNLSRVDVYDPELENTLDKIIENNGLTRNLLHLELTESAYTGSSEHVINVVKKLREKGYIIEMDDFGTGYSSLNMLTSMPVDILKLDMGFIRNIGKDEKDSRMVELIIDIAKNLKLTVVAEGVENQMQLDFLKERGCDLVQGYYFSKPIPSEEFEKLAFKNQ